VKVDQDYLKRLLLVSAGSNNPTFDIEELKSAGFDYNDRQFEFHMMILTDQGFIERDDRDPGFGLIKGIDGFVSWSVLPLRLTASGHRFIEAWSKSGARDYIADSRRCHHRNGLNDCGVVS
jgi:hypothetical protein